MKKVYDIQDKIDALFVLADSIADDINELLNDNERLSTELKKYKLASQYRKQAEEPKKDFTLTIEEQMYLEYLHEQYGKEC